MAWEIETVFELSDADLFTEIVANDIGLFMWAVVAEGDPGYDQYVDNLASYTVPEGATEFSEVQFDESVDPMPTWENTKERFFAWCWATHESEMSSMDIGRVMESLSEVQLEYINIRPRWTDTLLEPAEQKHTWAEMKAEWAIMEAADAVEAIVAAAYKVMDDNINAATLSTFGTLDRDSAGAFAQSWRLKMDNASSYSGIGLVALEEIAGFSVGDPLDTDQKVSDYYTEKVNQLIAFDIFRDAEIMTYLAAKAAAEA